MKKIFTILLILAIVSLGLAEPPPPEDITNIDQIQSDSGIFDQLKNLTDSCKHGIINFLGNATTCLPLNDLVAFVSNPNTTDATNKLADAICPGARCNDKILNLGKALISQGCAADIKDKKQLPITLLAVITFYTQLMEILCFKDSTNSNFCLPDLLGTINNLPDPDPIILKKGFDRILFCTPTAFCTECNQKISKVITAEIIPFVTNSSHADARELLFGITGLSQIELLQLRPSIMIKCGFQFLYFDNFTEICQ